jgi:hypothetical protein
LFVDQSRAGQRQEPPSWRGQDRIVQVFSFPATGMSNKNVNQSKTYKNNSKKTAFAACLYKRSANAISLINDRELRSRYLSKDDEGGMANPLAGERWRSRHDGARQRPSFSPLWDRDDLRSELRSDLIRQEGCDAARPSRADALGCDPRAASISGRDAARMRCSRQSPSGGSGTSICRDQMGCWTSTPRLDLLFPREARRM